jgi:hypothetical protein
MGNSYERRIECIREEAILIYIYVTYHQFSSRDVTVDVATGYGIDGRGSISGKGKRFFFFTASRPALGPT